MYLLSSLTLEEAIVAEAILLYLPSFQTWTHVFKTKSPLGKLLMLKVTKESRRLTDDEWYCSKIVVKTPEGEEILFPCYRWISNGELVELRGGRGLP